jgi:hypothetical protein
MRPRIAFMVCAPLLLVVATGVAVLAPIIKRASQVVSAPQVADKSYAAEERWLNGVLGRDGITLCTLDGTYDQFNRRTIPTCKAYLKEQRWTQEHSQAGRRNGPRAKLAPTKPVSRSSRQTR